jgi:hypothetical protein
VGQVLLGYFEVPFNMDDPVTIAINPTGNAARCATRCVQTPTQCSERAPPLARCPTVFTSSKKVGITLISRSVVDLQGVEPGGPAH